MLIFLNEIMMLINAPRGIAPLLKHTEGNNLGVN
jgi:hypothetical protein